MSEYYVSVEFKDNSSVRVEFDSFKEFYDYMIRIDKALCGYTDTNKEFIDIGNREYCAVLRQMIKRVQSQGFALKDSQK